MRASAAVSLLFAGSMSIFGIFSTHRKTAPAVGIEPVWVDGQMGVYSPDTGEFVPSTAPNYAAVCDEIRDARDQSGSYGSSNYGGGSYYRNYHYYGSNFGGASGLRSSVGGIGSGSSSSSSSHSFGSVRGGIGSTGHAMGGSHA